MFCALGPPSVDAGLWSVFLPTPVVALAPSLMLEVSFCHTAPVDDALMSAPMQLAPIVTVQDIDTGSALEMKAGEAVLPRDEAMQDVRDLLSTTYSLRKPEG